MITLSCIFMFYFGLKTFFFNKKYLLMMLLSLEFLTLVILLLLVNLMSMFDYDLMFLIYFMIVMVCEAVLGLILLTLIVRSHGSDYMKSMIFIMC
uniref:NADH-ubiquinone oxidoreductase chain 4L n=1 Tax=Lanthanaphalara mira TaxID=2218050 RepID=A0A344A2G6_9HEMI|nr:NADH dehydrogenase subunit 4L [Lanthanaphalara mira]AWU48957.1 NADH dehydrogenase subunit 4L [Lanthanaphalara mira]